ncbi:MAG: glycosyltransferase [Phycisphaera sp.]|nr:MAG: glycosyltransferase [Phycisphaera sp.]
MSGVRVAIVAYYFPPIGGAGTQRAAKLCRYLHEFGWTPTVVCGAPSRDSTKHRLSARHLDKRMVSRDLPADLAVHRIEVSDVGAWVDETVRHLESLIKDEAIDAILVTMSPFWLAPLVERFGSRLPVVADLRDPWALDGVPKYRHWFQWKQDLRAMGRTLGAARHVVMNTPEARAATLRAFDYLDASRVHAIPNGFDRADFEQAEPAPRPEGARFTLVHTGTFLTYQAMPPAGLKARLKQHVNYRPEPIRPIGRSVGPLLEAIDLVRREKPALMEGFRFVHVGNLDDATKAWIDASPSRDLVDSIGYLSHNESVGQLLSADALFLHLHGLPPGHRARIVPGKTYEYLASGRPILGALPEGDARDLLAERDRCLLADPCDPASIARALETLIERGSELAQPVLADPDLEPYDRRQIAQRMAGVLDACVGRTNKSEAVEVGQP